MGVNTVVNNKRYKIRSSIALVKHDGALEIFNTNTRDSALIKIDFDGIIDLIRKFDGKTSLLKIKNEYKLIEECEIEGIVDYLKSIHAIIEMDAEYGNEYIEKYRIINIIEDYSTSSSEVIRKLKEIKNKTVLIFGLGAVGTWVAQSLAMSDVGKFIIVDDDFIEDTNIHRQGIFSLADIGKYKVDCAKSYLEQHYGCEVQAIKEKLDSDFFKRNAVIFDLAINCADYPSVDATTKIIGFECMKRNLPHIIGGGYNLHLTLIGQTVIPGKTACVNCFEKELNKINQADLNGVRKLHREHRKIGSFGPICGISASITSIEAFKVLINSSHKLINTNRRIEFLIDEMDFSQKEIERNPDCDWCGENGFFQIKDKK